MQRSTEHILTTHTGSLPRPYELRQLLLARESGQAVDKAQFDEQVQQAVFATTQQEVATGIDIISDGEMSKPGFTTYVRYRLTGFGGESEPFTPQDMLRHPDLMQQRAGGGRFGTAIMPPACIGEVKVSDPDAIIAEVEQFKKALHRQEGSYEEAFMTAASPGVLVQNLENKFYPTEEAYLYALADAMRYEYQAIVNAGFILQVDCPDLASDRKGIYAQKDRIHDFRAIVQRNIEALNYALQGLDPERVRVHTCHGNWPGPHDTDIALPPLLDLLLTISANALVVELAHPQHRWEWKGFAELIREKGWPEEKILVVGCIDTKQNGVEHPETVAEQIKLYAHLLGKERIIAGTDCGFGTFAAFSPVAPSIAWTKLQSLVEGAKLASQELW